MRCKYRGLVLLRLVDRCRIVLVIDLLVIKCLLQMFVAFLKIINHSSGRCVSTFKCLKACLHFCDDCVCISFILL